MAVGHWLVFGVGTIANAVLAIIYVRVVLPLISMSGDFAAGPADPATLKIAIPLAIGIIQIGLIVYTITTPVSSERARRTV